MQSKAATVEQYLSELPPDRRAALSAVRKTILENIDTTYEEGMQGGMIGYYVPHGVFPAGYHCDPRQPLPFAGLASQKNHMALYMMCIYGSAGEEKWLRERWASTGKRLDMGKSCIRFKKLEDLPLEVVGEAIRRVPAKSYIERYEAGTMGRRSTTGPTPRKNARTKPTPRRARARGSARTKAAAKKVSSAKKSARRRGKKT